MYGYETDTYKTSETVFLLEYCNLKMKLQL